MKKRIVLWILLIVAASQAISWAILGKSFEDNYMDKARGSLQTYISAVEYETQGEEMDYQKSADALEENAKDPIRITFIAADGKVLGDSNADAAQMEDHEDRPEVQQALGGGYGESVRRSETVNQNHLYVAKQLPSGVILRVSMPLDFVKAAVTEVLPLGILLAVSILIVTLLFSQRMVKSVLAPMQNMQRGVQDYLEGKTKRPYVETKYRELEEISYAFLQMSDKVEQYVGRAKREAFKVQFVLDHMNEGLMVVNHEKGMVLINQAAKKIFGVQDQTALSNLLMVTRREDILQAVDEAIQSKKGKKLDFSLDAGETTYRMFINSAPMQITSGDTPDGAILLISDVSEIIKTERMRDDFVANVSHELKTPLTSIHGFAQLLSNDMTSSQEDVRRYAQMISVQADRLTGLINDILKLSELEQITVEKKEQEVDVRQCAENVVGMLSEKAEEKEIAIKLAGHATMLANATHIQELLTNLLENAIKYNRMGGKVDILIEQDARQSSISVLDTGIGIPADEVGRVFERFYRAKNAGGQKVEGTGLGLSIVKHIALLYGGRVECLSEEGVGSKFTVVFPG